MRHPQHALDDALLVTRGLPARRIGRENADDLLLAQGPFIGHCRIDSQEAKDHALHAGLASFESYVGVATPLGQLEEPVITTALTALEQLAALPQNYAEARDSVAIALGKAIQKKLAA